MIRTTQAPIRIRRRPLPAFCCDPDCGEPTVEVKRFCASHLANLQRIKAELDATGDWKVSLHKPGRGLEEAA